MMADSYRPRYNPFLLSDIQPRDSRTDTQLRLTEKTASDRLEKHPTDSKQLYIRSQARMKLGNLENALSDICKYLLLQPESVDGYYLRGCVFQKLRKINEAIRDFSFVLEKDSDHFNAQVARASCFNFLGQFDKAIKEYQVGLSKSTRVHRTSMSDSDDRSIDLINNSNLSDIAENLMALTETDRIRPPLIRSTAYRSASRGKTKVMKSPNSFFVADKSSTSSKSALSTGINKTAFRSIKVDAGRQSTADK